MAESLLRVQNFIGGQFRDAVKGKTLDNYEPATGRVYSTVPDSDEEDVELAYVAARDAFPAWSKMTREQRSKLLNKVADLVESRLVRELYSTLSVHHIYSITPWCRRNSHKQRRETQANPSHLHELLIFHELSPTLGICNSYLTQFFLSLIVCVF